MAKHPLYCFVWEDQSVAAFLNKRFQPSGGPGSCLMQLHLLLPKRHPCAKTQTWHWCGSAWLEAVFAIIYIYIYLLVNRANSSTGRGKGPWNMILRCGTRTPATLILLIHPWYQHPHCQVSSLEACWALPGLFM